MRNCVIRQSVERNMIRGIANTLRSWWRKNWLTCARNLPQDRRDKLPPIMVSKERQISCTIHAPIDTHVIKFYHQPEGIYSQLCYCSIDDRSIDQVSIKKSERKVDQFSRLFLEQWFMRGEKGKRGDGNKNLNEAKYIKYIFELKVKVKS